MATSASLLERMRKRAQRVKTEHSGAAYPRWDLSGKKATIAKGASAILRLMPRWDIANKYSVKNGKLVENPKYVEDMIYAEAREHWYTRAKDQQRLPAICLKTFDPKARCPLCELAAELRDTGDAEDAEQARELEAKELFLYNAIKGRTGERTLTDAGLVDIRVLPLWGSLYVQITDMMTGGGDSGDDESDESFRCDDLSDEREGYDLKFTRPADKTERWKIVAARKASPLFTEADKAAFKGWRKRLVDIPKALATQQQSYEALYEAATGEKPPKAGATTNGAAPRASRKAAPVEALDEEDIDEADEDEIDEAEIDEEVETETDEEEADEEEADEEEADEEEADEEEADEEPAPVKVKARPAPLAKKKAAAPPEEDDDAFGFDMPDEEEAPAPKKKPTPLRAVKKKR